jgi:hypothetical protein
MFGFVSMSRAVLARHADALAAANVCKRRERALKTADKLLRLIRAFPIHDALFERMHQNMTLMRTKFKIFTSGTVCSFCLFAPVCPSLLLCVRSCAAKESKYLFCSAHE